MNLSWTVSDLRRRLSRIINIGVVSARQGALASVDVDGYVTDLLPIIQLRAGDTRSNLFPDPGEEVIVLAPSGELNQGIILGSLNNIDNPAVSTDTHRTEYPDGSFVEFDPSSGSMSVSAQGDVDLDAVGNLTANIDGNVAVVAGGTCDLVSTGDASITAPTITLNGNAVINGTLTVSGVANFSALLNALASIAATGQITVNGTPLNVP